MLKDITIGQYYPTNSVIHKLDPRLKIIAVFIYLVSLFMFNGFAGYLLVTIFLVATVALSKVPVSYLCKGIKSVLILIIFTALFNVFWGTGTIVFQWKFITITKEGLWRGGFLAFRLLFLVLGSSMLTYTTTPNQLTDGIETLLKPLQKIKVPVHEVAMMMSLALRFIPILMEEANRIMMAQSARGADFEEGNIIQRMKAMMSLLVPLLVSATRRAYDLASAMEARCYRGGEGRTKMKPLCYQSQDRLAYLILIAYLICMIVLSYFVKAI